ncbi:MAG: hypothetical protein ABII64_02890 [Elusimicrobiota bacterium]
MKKCIKCVLYSLVAVLLAVPESKGSDKDMNFIFNNEKIEGVVGNGRLVVTTLPGTFTFQFNKIVEKGRIGFEDADGRTLWLDDAQSDSVFEPGAAIYETVAGGRKFRFIHAVPYNADVYSLIVLAGEAGAGPKNLIIEIDLQEAVVRKDRISVGKNVILFNGPFTAPEGPARGKLAVKIPLRGAKGGKLIMSMGPEKDAAGIVARDPEEFYKEIRAHYTDNGIILNTPDADLNRAVNFIKYHMQLGYDWPRTMVCDMFRWRDVWSRDLGSGFGPGAIYCGMFEAARNSILYETGRYSKAKPEDLKVSGDASQGGSAEGIGLVLDCAWKYYMYTADKGLLAKIHDVFKPWADMWILRDYDEDGLVTDVTEWMDHSRFFRLPEGLQSLYSNALFSVMTERMGNICGELGYAEESRRYYAYSRLTKKAINAKLWNNNGYYDNYLLWGLADDTLDAYANALAVLYGISGKEKNPAILDSMKRLNWRRYGSANISKPMKFVDAGNDQNVKCWPWWEAKEAKARFLNGDAAGGRQVLKWCTDTLGYRRFPGLLEEYLNPDTGQIEDFAGHTFITGAGSVMDAIAGGMLGFEVTGPGAKEIRISPNVPADWKKWSAVFPLPDGKIIYRREENRIIADAQSASVMTLALDLPRGSVAASIRVNDAPFACETLPLKIPVAGKPAKIVIELAQGQGKYEPDAGKAAEYGVDKRPVAPAKNAPQKTAAIFYEPGFMRADSAAAAALKQKFEKAGYKAVLIDADGISALDAAGTPYLAFAGNGLPYSDKKGGRITAKLDGYINAGGKIFLCGPVCMPKGKMGEKASLIEWQDYSAAYQNRYIEGKWKLKISDKNLALKNTEEGGYINKFYAPSAPDADWTEVNVAENWEKALGYDYNGWAWYRKKVYIPEECRNKTFFIALGMIDDNDWTYLNGELLGETAGWTEERVYALKPGSAAHKKIVFGAENLLAVQVQDNTGGGGIYSAKPALLYPGASGKKWQYYDEISGRMSDKPVRTGTVYWGAGGYFPGWAFSAGLFGMSAECGGVEFVSELSKLKPLNIKVRNVYTDFSVKYPWQFIPLAYTARDEKLLSGPQKDRYPCMAYVRNALSGGGIYLIAPEIASSDEFRSVLKEIGE